MTVRLPFKNMGLHATKSATKWFLDDSGQVGIKFCADLK